MVSILISGAGIAGLVLAYWLGRRGLSVTVVEKADGARSSGSPVDVRGQAVPIVEAMGVLPRLREAATRITHLVFLGRDGRTVARVRAASVGVSGIEVPRADLVAALYGAARNHAEFVFGDSIAVITQDTHGVDVAFEHSPPRRFDLVVGADGLHSNVRQLVFGPESDYVRRLGMYVATARLTEDLDPTEVLLYNTPGRLVALHPAAGDAGVAFIFRSAAQAGRDPAVQRRVLAKAYAGEGWRVPDLLERACEAEDLYFDAVSRVRLDTWSHGRVTLLGDAATSVSLLADGASTAIAGAHTLAAAVAANPGDHTTALRRYEEAHRTVLAPKLRGVPAAKAFLVPRTRLGLATRNLAMRAVGRLRR